MQTLVFAARCVGVSLAVFVLLYVVLSLAIARAWKFIANPVARLSPRHAADFWFALRMLPLVVSTVVTLTFTLPSFLLLEPRSGDEPVGTAPLALGLCCLILVAFGVVRAIRAQRKTSQALAGWLRGAERIESDVTVPVFRTGNHTPSLTVAGVCTPRVLVSETALALLSRHELRTALRHEIAHVRSHDNLKKLLFRFSTFPGMAALEATWSEVAEMAADDAAVSNLGDALDLAAALIKLSRLAPVQPSTALATALLPSSSAALSARVNRLFAWRSEPDSPASVPSRWYALPAALGTLCCLAASYPAALVGMHAATEWLVR